jgi:hypothetical protein
MPHAGDLKGDIRGFGGWGVAVQPGIGRFCTRKKKSAARLTRALNGISTVQSIAPSKESNYAIAIIREPFSRPAS